MTKNIKFTPSNIFRVTSKKVFQTEIRNWHGIHGIYTMTKHKQCIAPVHGFKNSVDIVKIIL